MTYSVPELLLVGAAQNLVLETSDDHNLLPGCAGRELEDNFLTYDGPGLW